MIQYLSQPYPCCLSNNPIPFRVKAPNATPGLSVYPKMTLFVGRYLKDERFFYFSFINPDTGKTETIKFLGSLNPVKNGYLVPAHATGDASPPQPYVEDLAEHMRHNTLLTSYFTITVDGFNIIIEAKRAVVELVITDWVLNDTQNSGGVYALNPTISDQVYKAKRRLNHRVNIGVYIEPVYMSGEFQLVSSQSDTVDENGELVFDISSVIHSEIKASFSTPPLIEEIDPDAVNKAVKSNVLRRYYISATEEWNSMPFEAEWVKSDVLFAHFGGVSMEDYAKIHPIKSLTDTLRYLTWWPNKKRLLQDQSDWLGWMNATGIDDEFTVGCTVHYTDSTNDFQDIGTIELNKWETLVVPVGLEQLGLQNWDPLKTIFAWEIKVTGTDSEVEINRSYYLLEKLNPQQHDIVYLNAYGVPECFISVGSWKKTLQVKKEVATRSLSHDYTVINGQSFVFQQITRNTYTARSGNIFKKEAEALQGLLTTAPCFLYDKGYYLPILIDSANFDIDEEDEILSQLDFKVTKSMELKTYSSEGTKPRMIISQSCGLATVKIEFARKIDVFAQLTVTDPEGNLFETVLAPVGNTYELTQIMQANGDWIVETQVQVGDDAFPLREVFHFGKKRITFQSPDHGSMINFNSFEVNSSVQTNLFVNWEINDQTDQYTVLTGSDAVIFKQTNRRRRRNIVVEHPCFDSFTLFRVSGQMYRKFNLEAMKNLEVIEIVNCDLTGHFSLVTFRNAKFAYLANNGIDSFECGLPRYLEELDLSSNNLGAEAIERLVKELWDYRKVNSDYLFVHLYGNPGAAAPTQLTTDIITGAGVYVGDGLVDNNIDVVL